MSDNNALARKIATLTAKDTYDGRALRLGVSGQPESLEMLMQAIDETMLLRDVVFAVGSSSTILRISGKRVQAVVAASKDLGFAPDLINKPLKADDHGTLAQVSELLKSLTAVIGDLTLERLPVSSMDGAFGSGVGTHALNIDVPTQAADQMSKFLSECSSVLTASLMVSGGAVESEDGDATEIAALKLILDEKWTSLDKKIEAVCREDAQPMLRFLDGIAPADNVILSCVINDKSCLALAPTTSIGPVLNVWSANFS